MTGPLLKAVGDQMASSTGDAATASNPYVATASATAGATTQGQTIDDRIVYNGSSKELTDGQIESQETDEQTEKVADVRPYLVGIFAFCAMFLAWIMRRKDK